MKPTFNKYNNNNSETNKSSKKRKTAECSPSNKNEHQTNPLTDEEKHNSQIISGYFVNEKSYKELVIGRLNNFLYCVLGLLVISCFVCYYFVSCCEVRLNQISRATLELNYENEELQNKVDSLQSYYNIDKAVSRANILERAKQVLEVDAIDVSNINPTKKGGSKNSVVVSY